MLASADNSDARSGTASSQAGVGPQRSCRVCRTKKPKAELTRWVMSGGQLVQDERGSLEGRGWYSCSSNCAERLGAIIKSKRKTRNVSKN